MLQNIRLTRKFPLIMISLALISALATGFIAYQKAADTMQKEAEAKLYSLLESRESSLKRYFEVIRQDVIYHSQSPLVNSALKEFRRAWEELPGDKENYLKSHYIERNPFALDLKANLLQADDGSGYSQVHKQYHSEFANLIAARSFYDVFLIDAEGNIIYSAKKELDFASNLRTGLWRDSNLGKAILDVSNNISPGFLSFADFAPYAPSENKPASFVAAPVFDAEKKHLGMLAFQMPIDELNAVMQVTAGMGETGETYLVGDDYLMRSDSRFYSERSILKKRVETTPVKQALAGEEGVKVAQDYRNISVFSAYKPIDFFGTRWAILAEIDEMEVLAPVVTLNRFLTISGIVIGLVITILGYFLATDLANPIVTMTDVMRKLARNELNVNLSVSERRDEVGGMAQAMLMFKDSAIERERLREKLGYLAEHDSLTNLPNRNYAMTHLKKIIEEHKDLGKKVAIMFADLDGFKNVNDQFGHQVGDHILKEVSSGFSACLRDKDVVARIGGDEFLLILPDIQTEEDCVGVASKLLKSTDKVFSSCNEQVDIGVSIGIAIYPEHADEIERLLKIADDAMYSAKANGKNNFEFPARQTRC